MLNKSIAYRLSIYISLAVIGVFVAFIAIYFFFNQKIIKENVQNEAIRLSSDVIGDVRRHIISIKEVSNNVSDQIYFYMEHGHSDEFITTILKKYPFIHALHINFDEKDPAIDYTNFHFFKENDSVQIQKSNERINTCILAEESVAELIENKVSGWSKPFICKRNNNYVVLYYTPIMQTVPGQEARQIGEILCELSLLDLNASINRIKIGRRGYAFLIARDGYFITHPDQNLILNRNVYNLPEKSLDEEKIDLNAVLGEGLTGNVISYAAHLDYEKCWVYYTPIKESSWMLVFLIPYKELYEPLYLPILQMLFFSVLGILIIYLLITYITNKQIQPLDSVTKQLKIFSSLTGDMREVSDNEVVRISESLNFMKSWHEKYKMSQTEEAQKSKSHKEDIHQASEIQRSFIRTDFPAFPDRSDIDLYAIYKPAKGVSGDLFDFFFMDDAHLVCTIGDVSGKGIPAAFFMSVAQTIIKNNAREISAKSIVTAANKELYTTNQHQFFLTLFLAVLNVKTGKLVYCNAAHTAPYILKANGSLVNLAQSHGLPLGLYFDKNYEEAEIKLEKDDSLVLYTDGVTELQDKHKLQYGNIRLEENLKSLVGLDSRDMVLKIEKSLNLFIGTSKQSDDISLLILKYKP